MKKTDYFKTKDNFAQTAHIRSIPIIESRLGNTPKVTVAIPTFKRPDLLKETVDSVINQIGYSDFDILVVDNNPERNCETEKLMHKYNEPRLSYYKNTENIGVVGNLNRIYLLSKGEYVVELHDDDLLLQDFLSILMKFIEISQEKYDAIYPEKLIYNMNKSNKIPERKSLTNIYIQDLEVFDFLWGNVAGTPEHIINKKAFLKIGGYNTDFFPSCDYDLYIRLAFHFKTCKLIGYPLSIYRIQENESRKTENLVGFVTNGTSFRKSILELSKNKVYKHIWMRYNNAAAHSVLKNGKKLFKNAGLDTNIELANMGIRVNKYDNLLFKLMKYYQIIASINKRTPVNYLTYGEKVSIN